ncbi:MAG TPA: nitrilase-related carbon-nitrogen hydrolase [Verrucomicrobiae bacterium]|jgi:apolipoprotein N-acyltransferase
MNISRAYGFALAAVVSFHLAFFFPPLAWLMLPFLFCLLQLANLATFRLTFLFGAGIGLLSFVPHLTFFWSIFGASAITLWCVLAAWLGLYLVIGRACLVRFGPMMWAISAPFLWSGLEYTRSELYYLRFSWMDVGYAFSDSSALSFMAGFGVYGIGFVFMAWAAYAGVFMKLSGMKRLFGALALAAISTVPCWLSAPEPQDVKPMNTTGIQLENSPPDQVKAALDAALRKYPQTDLFVLSEYTFDGPVPAFIPAWCKQHNKWLAVGAEDPVPPSRYFDTVFVFAPDGHLAFHQAKCVPVQFMQDGLPSREQNLWDSPWGKVGFAVCYDASYTRVADELIRQGAQGLIFPSMDSSDWGGAEHRMHARIAPMRAAEYGIPIFRVCSSGISQYVSPDGKVLASAPFPGPDEMLFVPMEMTAQGRIPLGRAVAQLSAVLSVALVLFLIVDVVWAPKLPEP